MSDQDLLDIISSLKALQIQQQQITRRQQDLTEQLDHLLAGRRVDSVIPLRDDTTAPNPSIQANSNRRRTSSPITSGSASPSIVNTGPNRSTYTTPNIIPNIGASTHRQKFIVGEQVYITNRITHSINPGPLDRAAIVTRVRPRRIDFRTFSGQETWRSPGNLRHLTEQEIASINNLLNSNS